MNARKRWKSSNGFTLVELLVVIAIIGVLVALLLPAVQAAREAARRMQCTNNLKQLALANHNYHDVHKKFPPSHIFSRIAPPNSNLSNVEGWGWMVLIMPQMEQQGLYDTLKVNEYTLHDLLKGANPNLIDPKPLLQTPIQSFICPSDTNSFYPLVHNNRNFNGGKSGAGNWKPAAANYVTSRGTRNNWQRVNDTHGMFMACTSTKMADVFDGTSNTFLIGERDTQYCRGATWIGVRNPTGNASRGFYYVTANVRVPLNSPDPPNAWNSRRGCSEGFSSLHTSGANFAFADGSVRFISDNVEYKIGNETGPLGACKIWDVHSPGHPRWTPCYAVYTKLGRRNDGFPIGTVQ